MSGRPLKVKDMLDHAGRFMYPPGSDEKAMAKQALIRIIGDLQCLIDEPSDAVRVRRFKKFLRATSGFGSLEMLLALSAIANPSPAYLRKKKQIEKARKKWMEGVKGK